MNSEYQTPHPDPHVMGVKYVKHAGVVNYDGTQRKGYVISRFWNVCDEMLGKIMCLAQ